MKGAKQAGARESDELFAVPSAGTAPPGGLRFWFRKTSAEDSTPPHPLPVLPAGSLATATACVTGKPAQIPARE